MTAPQEILAKIKKLLNLANAPSATEGEAAAAAGRAQALMTKYQIEDAMLDLEENKEEPENIRDWEDPLDSSNRLPSWRAQLAMAIAAVNSCKIYRNGPHLKIIGEQRDAQSVRYMYAFLTREITKLSMKYAGNGRTWTNNWRHGVVDTLRMRLREAQKKAMEELYQEHHSTGTSLMVLDNAVAVVERRKAAVEVIGQKLGLRSRGGSKFWGDSGARAQGRQDGKRINLGGGGARIGGGTRRLKG